MLPERELFDLVDLEDALGGLGALYVDLKHGGSVPVELGTNLLDLLVDTKVAYRNVLLLTISSNIYLFKQKDEKV